ncbi:MAG: hypothetical protein LUO88_02250 [Methanoregulaceae archaeon]|nr:hypothetical protein [Methanoregulaceae archaeon]
MAASSNFPSPGRTLYFNAGPCKGPCKYVCGVVLMHLLVADIEDIEVFLAEALHPADIILL